MITVNVEVREQLLLKIMFAQITTTILPIFRRGCVWVLIGINLVHRENLFCECPDQAIASRPEAGAPSLGFGTALTGKTGETKKEQWTGRDTA